MEPTETGKQPDRARVRGVLAAIAGLALLVGLGLLLSPGWARWTGAGSRAEGELNLDEPEIVSDPYELEPAELEPRTYAALSPQMAEPIADRAPASAADAPGGFDCVIEPSAVIEIGSPVSGVLETVDVERSDVVEAGQVVARLESKVELAAVDLARVRANADVDIQARVASLELGQRRNARVGELYRRKTLSADQREQSDTERQLAQLELDRARHDQRLARLELRQAEAILERRRIRTPIAGVVTNRLLLPGEVVDEDTILEIARIDPLHVEVILPAAMFGSVTKGMRAAVEPEIPGDEIHVAEVAIVDRVIDSASGTFGVRLELPNPEHAIPGGLHCQVTFSGD